MLYFTGSTFSSDRFYGMTVYNLSEFGMNILSPGESNAQNCKSNMAAVIC